MEDYEEANALEWDLNRGGRKPRQESEDAWQVVGDSRKNKKQQQQPLQNPPVATPSSSQNIQVQGRVQQLPPAPARPSSERPSRKPRPAIQAFENLAPSKANAKPQNQGQTQTAPKAKHQRQQITPLEHSVAQASNPSGQQNQAHQPRQYQPPPQWLNQEARRQQPRPQRRVPKITQGSDNAGERLWRNRQEANGQVRIPTDLALQHKGQEEIARQHGTFVYAVDDRHGYGAKTFGVWGMPEAVVATLKDINAWLEDYRLQDRANGSGKFVNVCSLTEARRIRAEREWEREVKRHLYRQFPPPDKAFEAVGSFHWPVKDNRPEEILGSSFEALDPIRMEFKCYVVFNKDQGQFQVMGRADAVQDGLMRLRGTCFQIAARQIPPVERYLLSNEEFMDFSTNVVLTDYAHLHSVYGIHSNQIMLPRLDNVSFDAPHGFLHSASIIDGLRDTVLLRLQKLHYYHGSVQMRIRLGTFLATRYIKTDSGLYPIDEYKAMIRQSTFRGEVTQELGANVLESAALSTLRTATGFLTPQDPMVSDLTNIKPVYTALFTFVDPTNSEAGDIRLTMIWEELQDSVLEKTTYDHPISKKWTRLERDAKSPTEILNISLSDLATGMAWQFDINAAQTIDESRLPRALSEFEESVHPDAKIAHKTGDPANADVSFVKYGRSNVHLRHIEQRITYRYGVTGSDYTLELIRFQHSSFPERKIPILSKVQPTLYEARWGLSLHRIQWDFMFTENERLPVGKRADWSHDEDVWFPNDIYNAGETKQKGFEQMMEKLNRIASLVTAGEKDNLLSGMQVG